MWQALFATGDGDIVSTGLFKICQEAKKLIKDVKITNLKLKVDDDNLGLLAKDLFEIPSVKRWLLQQVGTQTTIGPGIDPKTKHWRDRPMHREISSQKFGVKGLAQTDFIKEAADFDKYVGTIETFQLDITRRQVRKLATLTGICKVDVQPVRSAPRTENVVVLVGYNITVSFVKELIAGLVFCLSGFNLC